MKTYFDRYLEARMQDPEFKKAYEAAETRAVVYLVGWVGVESYAVEHVCGSKETAKRWFEKIRKRLLCETNKPSNMFGEHLAALEKTTFENPEYNILPMPYWRMYKVED